MTSKQVNKIIYKELKKEQKEQKKKTKQTIRDIKRTIKSNARYGEYETKIQITNSMNVNDIEKYFHKRHFCTWVSNLEYLNGEYKQYEQEYLFIQA